MWGQPPPAVQWSEAPSCRRHNQGGANGFTDGFFRNHGYSVQSSTSPAPTGVSSK